MTKLLTLFFLLLWKVVAFAQNHYKAPATIENVSGTYHYKAASMKLNSDLTCKIVITFPQKLTYDGNWSIINDTLVCAVNHISFDIDGINEELKNDPFSQKYLLLGNTLSLVDGQQYGTIIYRKE